MVVPRRFGESMKERELTNPENPETFHPFGGVLNAWLESVHGDVQQLLAGFAPWGGGSEEALKAGLQYSESRPSGSSRERLRPDDHEGYFFDFEAAAHPR